MKPRRKSLTLTQQTAAIQAERKSLELAREMLQRERLRDRERPPLLPQPPRLRKFTAKQARSLARCDYFERELSKAAGAILSSSYALKKCLSVIDQINADVFPGEDDGEDE